MNKYKAGKLKAEEYAEERCKECYMCDLKDDQKKTECFGYRERKESFIDGYNEGLKAKVNFTTISDCPIKFEWHYVKNELPTNTGLYLIYYKDAFFDINVRTIARYSPDRKEFLNLSIEDGDEVIAWCELPKPPEEIK